MAGRHADAARTAQIAHGPRKRRHRGYLRVHMRHDAIRSQNGGRHLHEQLAFVARVARDGDARVFEMRIQIVGEALRCATHRVDIHAIRARAQRSAQARRAERQILEERIHRGGVVARIGRSLHLGQLGRKLFVGNVGNPTVQFSTHIAICHFLSPNTKAAFRIAIKAQPFAALDVRLRKIPHVEMPSGHFNLKLLRPSGRVAARQSRGGNREPGPARSGSACLTRRTTGRLYFPSSPASRNFLRVTKFHTMTIAVAPIFVIR